jgi:chromosome segregation ATPase
VVVPSAASSTRPLAAQTKAEKDLETAETAQKTAETERDQLKAKVTGFEEQARQVTLRDERLDALGAGFLAKLGEKTKDRLRTQAGELKDDDWTARLEELEELTSAKRDDGARRTSPAAATRSPRGDRPPQRRRRSGASSNDPTPNQRRSVLAGLSKTRR